MGGRAEQVTAARADPGLLATLGVGPAFGRWFTHDEERRTEPVVVISHAFWQRNFASDPRVVGGSTIRFGDRAYTVIGVLPPNVGYPVEAELWYPYPDNLAVEVVARVRPGVAIPDVRRELRALAPSVEDSRKMGIPTEIVVATLHERIYGPNGPVLRLLLGTVALLLILTCTNVANLSLARTLERRRELAVCVALGASRQLLALHVLIENALLAVGGTAAGVVAASWATALLVRLAPPELPGVRGAAVGIREVLVAATIAMLVSLAVSIAPALAITRGDLRSSMGRQNALGASGSSGATRGALVVAQLAIALLLVTASGLLVRSMVRLLGIDTGFERRGLVSAHVQFATLRDASERRRALIDQLAANLRRFPGVQSVAVGPPPVIGGRGLRFSEGWDAIFAVRDSASPGAPLSNVWVKYVDPAYIETFGIRLRTGRGITTDDDATGPAVALVNAAAERMFFQGASAVGRRLEHVPAAMSGGRQITVVGVMPNVRQRDLTIPAYPEIWLPLKQQELRDNDFYISAKTLGDADALVPAMRGVIASFGAGLEPRWIVTLDDVVSRTLAPQRYVLVALGGITTLALLLAALGLYAVTSYTTSVRTREIGVRMAVGAQPHQVLWMVLGDGLRITLLGITAGLLLAAASSRVIGRFLYEINAHDASTFLTAPAILAIAALIALYVPARRATRVDPVLALRDN